MQETLQHGYDSGVPESPELIVAHISAPEHSVRVPENESTVVLIEISPRVGEARAMFDALNRHHLAHCPPEVCHLTTADDLEAARGVLLGAFEQHVLCGIGGVKFFDEYGEITRMFVAEEHRGKGIASRILDELLRRIEGRGLRLARLETSDAFEEAMKMYLARGFVPCAPFGRYVDEPYNTYMQKRL